ncbi:MFS transporter [Streptomyces sulfonofaciens]|uniref:MFS transporter n=1 Tax=Streptomyces sulfonofaciens TaxID=68272 RepID=A0A919L5Y6_9ACTN|nr:MFS transporter [Streptomyces sulfonofaciens]GHH86140.1 MFS transporter [Streptomyces sulfonofaciens]
MAPPPQQTPRIPAPPASGAARAGAAPGAVLLVVSSAVFLASLDLFIVNIALPAIRQAFPGEDLANASWVLNGYTVVFAAFLAPAGRLADRYGRRRAFLVGTALFTAGSAACAAAPTIPLLVAFRAVQALGAALVMPTSLALLLSAFPAARRAVAVSVWSAVGGVAAAAGPPLGGLLVPLSWRWIFLVNLPVGLLALAFGPKILRESKDTSSGVPDLPGAGGLVLGIGALTWALVSGSDDGWGSPRILAAGALSALALTWVALRSRRHPVPVLDLAALSRPPLWLACTAMLLFTVGFGSMLFGNVLFLTGSWHYSVIAAGLALAPGPAVVVVVSLTATGRLAGRFGPGPVAAAGALSFAAGAASWVWRMGEAPHYATELLPGQFLTGLGVGLILPSLSGVVGTVLPSHQWGAGSSLINTARQIGAVLGVALLVVVYGPAPGLDAFRRGWTFLAAVAVAAALAAAAMTTRMHSGAAPRPGIDQGPDADPPSGAAPAPSVVGPRSGAQPLPSAAADGVHTAGDHPDT